jgi:hypothetical protein
MAFLIPLTETERREHLAGRIGAKTLRTIASRLAAARQYREHLPAAFDLDSFEVDATRAIALGEMLKSAEELRDAVHDTLLAVANRAIVAASSVYHYIQVGSDSAQRMKRTVDKLATRTVRASAEKKPAAPDVRPAPAPANADAPATPGPAASAPTPGAKVESTPEPTNKAA